MKLLFAMGALAAILVAPAAAQDCPAEGGCKETEAKANGCPLAGVFCKKDGKCEGKCKEICERGVKALKAVQARVGELMKKEAGCACECTAGSCAEKSCASCDALKTKVFHPILKARAAARFDKEGFKDAKHTVKVDGKDTETACTFLSGDTCSTCVNEMADAAWAKMKELFASKKKECEKPAE